MARKSSADLAVVPLLQGGRRPPPPPDSTRPSRRSGGRSSMPLPPTVSTLRRSCCSDASRRRQPMPSVWRAACGRCGRRVHAALLGWTARNIKGARAADASPIGRLPRLISTRRSLRSRAAARAASIGRPVVLSVSTGYIQPSLTLALCEMASSSLPGASATCTATSSSGPAFSAAEHDSDVRRRHLATCLRKVFLSILSKETQAGDNIFPDETYQGAAQRLLSPIERRKEGLQRRRALKSQPRRVFHRVK